MSDMRARIESLALVAKEIRTVLASDDEPAALRLVADFIAQFDRSAASERQAMLSDTPPTTESERWDALIAGVAEMLANGSRLPVPRWAMNPRRFLARWWFVSPYRSLHASALVEAPAELANRGVFLHRASLESV